MKQKLALLSAIGGLILIVGSVFGVFFYAENRYALAQELKKVEQRLDYKIVSDQFNSIQQRIWTIQDRKPTDTTSKEELRNLELKKAEIQKKMDSLEKEK